MSHNGLDDYPSRLYATADAKVFSNRSPYYRRFNNTYVHLASRRAHTPSHMSPFSLHSGQDLSHNPRCHTSNWATPTLESDYDPLQPQVPLAGPISAQADAPHIRYTEPSTDGYPPLSQFTSISGAPSDCDALLNVETIATPGANLPTVAGALGSSIPIPIAVEEITLPPERRVLSSCDFGSGITLGDALKNDFCRVSGESMTRAFPSRVFAAKLAFWFMFGLVGNDFRPRRKQVTVVTTKRAVIRQPSKARLAHLIAREMERYLKECNLRRKPFPYGLDDIILRSIDLTSKGTIRPRLYVYVSRPRSFQSMSAATF